MKIYKIKKSKIDNKGLYANCDIKKGTRIIEYKGKIITRKQSEESPKFDNGRAIYLFNLNKRYDLDGDFKFNTARLINHSCEPNCEVAGSGFKFGFTQLKILKRMTNYLTITDLATIRTTNSFLVNAGQKIVLDILLEKDLDGE